MRRISVYRMIATLLCIVSLVLCGCSDKTDDQNVETPGSTVNNISYTDGVHDFSMTPTDRQLVENGASEYVLVLPNVMSTQLVTARDEFVYLFKRATNLTLPVVSDEGLTHDAGHKYISIGETSLLTTANIEIDKDELKYDGYRIVTKDNTIYLIGGSDYGSLFAVYCFFDLTFHYECYSANCIEIDTNIRNKELYNYSVKDIPDIAYRNRNYNKIYGGKNDYDLNNFDSRLRFREDNTDNVIRIYKYLVMNADGTDVCDDPDDVRAVPGQTSAGLGHSTLMYCPPDVYNRPEKAEYHPKWFADGESQLCLTAHGDETEYRAMVELMAKKIEMGLRMKPRKAYPDSNYVGLSLEDNTDGLCTCSACMETIGKFDGARSVLNILLLNDIIPVVEEWMNRPENEPYKRDLRYTFLAYDPTEKVPAVYNEATKKYELMPGLTMNEKIVPRNAVINAIDYQSPLFSEINSFGIEQTRAWSDISKEYLLWSYEANYRHYMYLYDSFSFFNNSAFQFYASVGTSMWYLESVEHDYALTAFNQLKLYLNSKLLWDCTLDIDELTANYFNAMYKDAAPLMFGIFNSTRAYYTRILKENNMYKLRSNYLDVNKAEYWSISVLDSWLDMYEDAFGIIEKYKAIDKNVYDMLHYNVAQEMVSPAFIKMELFADSLNIEEYNKSLALLETLVNEVGIKNISQYDRTDDKAMETFILKLKNAR